MHNSSLIISICLLLSLTACNPGQPSSPVQDKAPAPMKTEAAEKASTESVPEEPDPSYSAEIAQGKDFAEMGWELMAKEAFGKISLELDSATLTKILGHPDEKTEEQYWGADGNFHSEWIYQKEGLKIGMNRSEDDPEVKNREKRIDRITVLEPCTFKTKGGIGLHSSRKAVIEAYQYAMEEVNSESEWLIAGTIYGGLMFRIEEDEVKEMFLGALAD